MKNKIIALMLILILAITIASGCSGFDPVVDKEVWRFGHEEVAGGIQDIYAYEFKRLVEERTNGEVEVEIYRSGEIGGVMDYLEFTQGGLLHFGILNPGTTSTTVPENNVFYNHFLLPADEDDIQYFLRNSQAIEKLNAINERHEMKILDWFFEGHNAWTTNREVRSPEDFRGIRIRTMASPLIVASYQAYSANPTPMPYMEVYSGLQLRQIDAQVNPIFAIQEMGFYEVQDYLIIGRQDGFFAATVTNPDFYDSLSDERKEMLDEVIFELNDFIFDTQRDLNAERLEMIKESSDIEIIELTDEEMLAFREASNAARQVFINSVGEEGREILRMVEEEVAEIEGR